jgi:hypothetical protein
MNLVATPRLPGAVCVVLAAVLSSCTTSTAQPRHHLIASDRSSVPTPASRASARPTRPSDPGTDVVAWINAPPPPYRAPKTSTPRVPPADARSCAGTDVSARLQNRNGAGGHQVTYLEFRNTGNSTCLLDGYPRVTASQAGQVDVTATSGSFFDGGHAANMGPGATTLLGLETDTYCAARPGGVTGRPPYHRVSVTLPGGGTVSLAARGDDGFDVTCGLHVTRFFDPSYPRAEPVYPLAVLTAALELPPTAAAGRTLDYVVELGNPTAHRVDLDPCPGYVQAVRTTVPVKEQHALNCAPVGRLGPHQTVRFAMRLRIPADAAAGAVTLYWSLDSSGAPGLGTVVITR